MYGVSAMYSRFGLGIFDMANDPTCGLLQGGIFKPRCWAEQQNGPIVPGQSTNTQDSSFSNPPAYPPPNPPNDLTGTSDEIIAAQLAAQQKAYLQSGSEWATAQQAASKANDPDKLGAINWLWVGLAAAGAVVLLSVVGRR